MRLMERGPDANRSPIQSQALASQRPGPLPARARSLGRWQARSVEFLAGQFAAPADTELAVGVRKMGLHGVDRQVQLAADLPVGPPCPGEAGDGLLLWAELAGRDAAGAPAGAAELGEGLVGVPAGTTALRVLQASVRSWRALSRWPRRARTAP